MAADTFSGPSAVGRYWQARSIGFEVHSVDGRMIGTVEELTIHGEAATELVVRRGRGRRPLHVVPAQVGSVDPWRRTLVVRTAAAGPSRRDRAARGARGVAAAAVAGASRTPALVPPAKRAGYHAALLSAVVLWLYGLVVYAVVRVGLRVSLLAAKIGARVGVRLYAWIASATNAAIAAVNARRLSSHA